MHEHSFKNKKYRIVISMFKSSFSTMLLASIALLLGTLVDGILIGNYLTTVDMAAYGLIHPITILLLAVTGIFSSGSQILCTKHMSHGNKSSADHTFSLTFILLLIISVILTVVFLIFAEPITRSLGATEQLLPLAKDYCIGITIGFPGVLLATMLAPMAQLEGDQKAAVIAVLGMTIMNVFADIFNAVIIKGGILGMGIATSISSYFALFILIFHFAKSKRGFNFKFRNLDFRESKNIILPGLPTAGSRLFATVRTLALNYILLAISTHSAVAAYSARMNVGTFFASTGAAAGMSTLALTGIFYGEEDKTTLKNMFKIVMSIGVFLGAVIMVFLLLFGKEILSLYMKTDEGTLSLAVSSLNYCAISLPFYAANNILANYLQAIHRMKLTNLILFCQNLGFCVVSALALAPLMGVDAVWFCYVVGEVLTTVLYIVIAVKHSHKLPADKKNLLMLSKDYGIPDSDLLEGTITSKDQLADVLASVGNFVKEKQLSAQKAESTLVAFSEMATNILKHGFTPDKKHHIDYRLFKKDGHYILRLRDDCPEFDPTSVLDNTAPHTKGGIHTVNELVSDISYIKIMNMNNLIITI